MERTQGIPVVAMLGTSGGTSFRVLGVAKALEAIWHNTGNLLFAHAIVETVANPKFFVDLETPPSEIRKNADVLMIPAANLLNPAWDLTNWADLVERSNVPICIVGLGAQASLQRPAAISLQAGTERFIRAVAERTALIGVRGAYTAELLERMRIHNVAIVGCPSNFINPQVCGVDMARRLCRVQMQETTNWAHLVGPLDNDADQWRVEKHLIFLATSSSGDAIIQTHGELFKIVLGDPNLTVEERLRLAENDRALALSSMGDSPTSNDHCTALFGSYVRQKGRFFSDARTWIDQVGAYDVTIGMRIHGAVAAIQGNGMGICIAIDSRTWELASTMGYPWVPAREISDQHTVRDVAKAARFDPQEFEKRRSLLWQAYVDVIERSGLVVSPCHAGALGRVRS